MEKPLVSIVTPCYNAGRFISQTINSVISQTYNNWEMIIVDDCSTDDSEQIISHYSDMDYRIKYIKLGKNSGSPAAPRNRAIQEAKGEIVAFLDADDLWKPNKLEVQLQKILDDGCDIVYSNGEMIDENNHYIRQMIKVKKTDYKRTLKHDELSCSSVVIKKDLIGDCRFENKKMEDLIFWLRVLKKTGAVAWNANAVLYSYRVVGNSRSRNKIEIIKSFWNVLRKEENLGFFYAFYCYLSYLWINFKKYYVSR